MQRIYTHALQVRGATHINPRLSEETLPLHFISTVLQCQLQDRVCKTYMPTIVMLLMLVAVVYIWADSLSSLIARVLTELKLNHVR